MSGIFGVASRENCVEDLFYGTDYHSHLGNKLGGLAIYNGEGIQREIHALGEHSFRPQFSEWCGKVKGNLGIGVISDYEPQPLIIDSHLGTYAIIHVGSVRNLDQLREEAHRTRRAHFTEMGGSKVNPTELIATLINQGDSFVDGIGQMQHAIQGSSSLMLLTDRGIYLARDNLGRTPIVLGRRVKDKRKRADAYAAALETCSFPNQGFEIVRDLGPGEIGLMTGEGYEQLKKPLDKMQICSFLWIYYGYPASNYEGINVEASRYRTGAVHAKIDRREGLKIDMVAGIPDSGTAHAIGYANEAGVPYARPFVKYTPTWQRSFMPQEQETRDLIADKKLIPIRELVEGKRVLFCEDSIVRGTQLKETVRRLFEVGKAKEVHMRPACPPLTFGCKYLNFSRSKSELDLAARRAIKDLEHLDDNEIQTFDVKNYLDEDGGYYRAMVDWIRQDLGLTSLRYQKLKDMVGAIGMPLEKLCLGCWRI